MAPGRDLTTEADIEAALERARNEPELPHALSAEYDRNLDVVVLHVDNGRRLFIPREELEELQNATTAQLSQTEIFGGLVIAWPLLDVNLYLPYLVEGRYGSEQWMKSLQKPMIAA